uniref:Uncharacterized protein n=1 Tax=Labrus bergylta TaxID=56723 RepID=A0A3Q3FLZ1_9LABR
MQELTNPAVSWLSDQAWLQSFKRIFDSNHPHREPLPGEWDTELDSFQRLLVLRCLRADCLVQGLQDYVSAQLGQRFIEPQTSDLAVVFKDSSLSTPLIFVLSPGTDPADDLYKFADVMQFSKKMNAISLGQGQGPRAETMMHAAMKRGHWVFFQNCHLVHKDFRLWLTSLPSNKFPVSILQNGSKVTIEPPRGIKANLQKTYLRLTNDFITSSTKVTHLKSLLLSLCLFHGISLERRKFGPLGFNIPYEFTDRDLNICISQLKMFLDEYQDTPFKVLRYTAGEINFGGRVTDDWDRRCLLSVLEVFYRDSTLESKFAPLFNLRRGCLLHCLLLQVPWVNSELGKSAFSYFAPKMWNNLYPTLLFLLDKLRQLSQSTLPQKTSNENMNNINHENVSTKVALVSFFSFRYNKLLEVISQSLGDIVKALNGLVVMSSELELMANSLFNNLVPDMWKAKAYPSLKPLASWVSDLLQRINFLHRWVYNGIPPVFWISGYFFPQAFLTGTLQNDARRSGFSIDTIGFDFEVRQITEKPSTGCYIHGLFLEGARWDKQECQLTDSRRKELYTEMSVIRLIPEPNRKPPPTGVYVCPIYKTLTRAGTLSTTGHSTNYVIAVELPTDQRQGHWIKRGVALICALDY